MNVPETTNQQRTTHPKPLPDYPWQQVATDSFTLRGTDYRIAVDYFSRYLEVIQLRSTTSSAVINTLKSIFSRHGIPEILPNKEPLIPNPLPDFRYDNGPQFTFNEFEDFPKSYQFCHTTSSPHYPSSIRQQKEL